MLLLWAVGLWFDLIDVLLYDVRVNARECSIRAARDQITHRVVKGSLGACCWSSLSVLYLLFLQSVLYSSTNEACLSRSDLHLKRYFWSSVALVCFYKHKINIVLYILL